MDKKVEKTLALCERTGILYGIKVMYGPRMFL